ncbi:hypothetical protein ACOME3_000565 [Neoechinorhynchus agilis]
MDAFSYFGPDKVNLEFPAAWIPGIMNIDQFIAINFTKLHLISKLQLLGLYGYGSVKSVILEYKDEDDADWKKYQRLDEASALKINSALVFIFSKCLTVKQIRIKPYFWKNAIAIKMAVFGHEYETSIISLMNNEQCLKLKNKQSIYPTNYEYLQFRFKSRQIGIEIFRSHNLLNGFDLKIVHSERTVLMYLVSIFDEIINYMDCEIKVDVSDGFWHLFELSKNTSILSLSVDHLSCRLSIRNLPPSLIISEHTVLGTKNVTTFNSNRFRVCFEGIKYINDNMDEFAIGEKLVYNIGRLYHKNCITTGVLTLSVKDSESEFKYTNVELEGEFEVNLEFSGIRNDGSLVVFEFNKVSLQIAVENGRMVIIVDDSTNSSTKSEIENCDLKADNNWHFLSVRIGSSKQLSAICDSKKIANVLDQINVDLFGIVNVFIGNHGSLPATIFCARAVKVCSTDIMAKWRESAKYLNYISYKCQFPQRLCLDNPCHNGGLCVSINEEMGIFNCSCPVGFSGRYCETSADYHRSLIKSIANEKNSFIDALSVCLADVDKCYAKYAPEEIEVKNLYSEITLLSNKHGIMVGKQYGLSSFSIQFKTSPFNHNRIRRAGWEGAVLWSSFRSNDNLLIKGPIVELSLKSQREVELVCFDKLLSSNDFSRYRIMHSKEIDDDHWHSIGVRFSDLGAVVIIDDVDYPARCTELIHIIGAPDRYPFINGFNGCIRNINLNDQAINLTKFVLKRDTFINGCPNLCQWFPRYSDLCQNGGKCVSYYDTVQCDCSMTGYIGTRCTIPVGFWFNGCTILIHTIPSTGVYAMQDIDISLSFATYEKSVVLFAIVGDEGPLNTKNRRKDYLLIEINNNGGLRVTLDFGTDLARLNSHWGDYSDGLSHDLRLSPRRMFNRRHSSIDGNEAKTDIDGDFLIWPNEADLALHYPRRICIGGVLQNDFNLKRKLNAFSGCISAVVINQIVPLKRFVGDDSELTRKVAVCADPTASLIYSPSLEERSCFLGNERFNNSMDVHQSFNVKKKMFVVDVEDNDFANKYSIASKIAGYILAALSSCVLITTCIAIICKTYYKKYLKSNEPIYKIEE